MFPLNMKLNANNEEGGQQHLSIKMEFKGKRCVI